MNENKKVAWLYVGLTVVTAAVAVVFQYILLNNYAEESSGLYPVDSMPPVAFYIFLSVAAILFCTSCFMFRKELLPKELKRGTWYTSLLSAGAAIAAAFTGVHFINENKLLMDFSRIGSINKIELIGALMAFLSAVYFLMLLFFGKNKSNLVAFFSFFTALWTMFYLLGLCFDQTALVNSPAKVLRQVALIFLMLYQLMECRAHLGNAKPRTYFVFSSLAVIYVSASAVPELVLWWANDGVLTSATMNNIFLVVFVGYIVMRMIEFTLASDGEAVYAPAKSETKSKPKDTLFSSDDDNE